MSPEELETFRGLLGDVIGFDSVFLCSSPNIILRRHDNVAVFEYEAPGVYQGHYLFKDTTRTMADARDILNEMFSGPAIVIKGLTPLTNKAALLVTKRLGFTSYGDIETEMGPMRLSIMTKKEFQ